MRGERPALGGRGAGNPGADHVGDVQPHRHAGALIRPVFGDELPELFERGHQSRQRPKCTSARRTISLSTIAIAASTEIRPSSLVGSKLWVNSVVK